MLKKYRQHGFDTLSFLCLIVMVFLSAYSLESTKWNENLNTATGLALVGTLLGTALGISSFRKKQLTFLIVAYSLIVLYSFLIGFPSSLHEAQGEWAVFQDRIMRVVRDLYMGNPVEDAILFVTGASIFYWSVALWAGIAVARNKRPWLPLIFMGASLVTTQFFQPGVYRSALLSAIFFFLFLLFLSRQRFLLSQNRWKNESAYTDREVESVSLRTSLLLSLVVVIVAWSVPLLIDVATPGSKSQKTFVQSLENTGDFISNLFSPLQSQPVRNATIFGDTLNLGVSQPQGEDLLFTAIAPEVNLIAGNYYWKARTYATYEDGAWNAGSYAAETIEENTNALEQPAQVVNEEEFIFVAAGELNYYYVPGYTYAIDQPARILEEFKDEPFKDVIAWRPLLPLTENDSYRTTSYFLPLAYEDLEASGKNYPAAIKRMYLQLPDDFSNRITQLSDAITAGLKSNFSKTLAITDYLRRQYTYSTEVADIPQHLDPVFWFIFEEKSGFCNYYASAEVLMLRSIDIPARLAVGYAQGVEIEHGKVFGVRDRDSHAWVEVYFPEIGWVVFEPTSSQPAVQFPHATAETGDDAGELAGNIGEAQENTSSSAGNGDAFSRFEAIERRLAAEEDALYSTPGQFTGPKPFLRLLWYVPLAGVLGFLLFGKVKKKGTLIPLQAYMVGWIEQKGKASPPWLKHWADYRNLSNIRKIFLHLDRILRWIGYENVRNMTPQEKAFAIQELAPQAAWEIVVLLQTFQDEVFGERRNGDGRKDRAAYHIVKKELIKVFFYRWTHGKVQSG
ncbi:MAG: transglutaminase domain-containing protein [Chloroflexi bacterium]|nr:transglutaminase domain-containing protein [Chloroflexota bacterium]